MFNLKKVLKKENSTSKTFNYALGKVSLNFTLRVDVKEHLKDFLQCLKSAQVEVEEEIKKLSK